MGRTTYIPLANINLLFKTVSPVQMYSTCLYLQGKKRKEKLKGSNFLRRFRSKLFLRIIFFIST